MRSLATTLGFCGLYLLLAGAARAQTAAPAHLAVVDGTAFLDGHLDAATPNMPLVPGDRLRTTSGRVEVLFPDGTALDVDQSSDLTLGPDHRLRLAAGRALLRVPRARYLAVSYLLETSTGSTTATHHGDYQLASPGPSGGADEFEQWVAERDRALAPPAESASAQYLPPDLQIYGALLDEYGGWQYDPSYGYVWYPTVSPSWRPYFDGAWARLPRFGWTWIGAAAWSWPTDHYGRWGWRHGRWFWIPAGAWAPAWVAWGAAGDYLTWCPLGWGDQPVFALSADYADPWLGWVVMPRAAFGDSRVVVARQAVSPRHLHLDPAPFAVHARGPEAPASPSGVPAQAAPSNGYYSRTVPGGTLGRPGAPGPSAPGTVPNGRPGARPDKARQKKKGGGSLIHQGRVN